MRSEVVVIGAGPYGLGLTAHLRHAGVATHVLGQPMQYWRERMPRGMLVRSSWTASNFAAPDRRLSFEAFRRQRDVPTPNPTPLEDFIAYGDWFAERVAPDLDRRTVTRVERTPGGFAVRLADGEVLQTARVAMATGLEGYARRPAPYRDLPANTVLHSTEVADPATLAGRRVAVVGGGQSAIETAVLLHEAGADVEVIVRAPAVRWLGRSAKIHRYAGPLEPLLYAPHDVGPPGVSWLVATPALWRRLPLRPRERLAYRAIRPAASGWLIPRATDLRIAAGRTVVGAEPADAGAVRLRLDDGQEREVDTVVLGTGFQIDVGAHPLLEEGMRGDLARIGGYPRLGPGLESSVPGLYFVGAMAALSYGPVMRFVSGSWYAAAAVTRHVTRGSRRRAGRAPEAEDTSRLAHADA